MNDLLVDTLLLSEVFTQYSIRMNSIFHLYSEHFLTLPRWSIPSYSMVQNNAYLLIYRYPLSFAFAAMLKTCNVRLPYMTSKKLYNLVRSEITFFSRLGFKNNSLLQAENSIKGGQILILTKLINANYVQVTKFLSRFQFCLAQGSNCIKAEIQRRCRTFYILHRSPITT